jgi:hypothetical protein
VARRPTCAYGGRTETPSNPAAYQSNVGVVKLAEKRQPSDIVKKLRAALGK